jgi:hypothetical protein
MNKKQFLVEMEKERPEDLNWKKFLVNFLDDTPYKMCKYFESSRRPFITNVDKDFFWGWIEKNMAGHVACVSWSDDNDKVQWGFENSSDVLLFKMRWA